MKNSNSIFLDFYNYKVEIISDWTEVVLLIKKDFYAFLSQSNNSQVNFKIEIFEKDYPEYIIPEIQTSMQSISSLSYDVEDERFNDYYGELLTRINFKKNEAQVYSKKLEKVHEVVYLLILSRVGKGLDFRGFHKLHAFAVSYCDYAIVCMMPTKGGKSTLMLELLKNKNVKMISDDIPLIDSLGNVLPFPLKIGLDNIPNDFVVDDKNENIYSMKRTLYGTKQLISIKGILDRVENSDKRFKKIILIDAKRINSKHSFLASMKWINSFKALFYHGIIGVGTPIIFEYFWELGWRDFLKKIVIFLLRLEAFFIFSIKAEKYHLKLGTHVDKAANEILSKIDSKI